MHEVQFYNVACRLHKACIHQTDEKLKRKGIESLGGFLFFSWHFVVLYTRVYTQKVWTVYEMACFLCVHPGSGLIWLPVNLPPVVFVGSAAVLLTTLVEWGASLTHVRKILALPDLFYVATNFPGVVAFTFMFRTLARKQAESNEDLRLFSVRNAVCAVESDRAKVERNIASLMKDLKRVSQDCSLDEALTSFDCLVRDKMPGVVRASSGRAGVRYEHVVAMTVTHVFQVFDYLGGHLVESSDIDRLITTLVEGSVWSLASAPLAVAVCMCLCCRYNHLTGWQDFLFTFLVAFATFFVGVFLYVSVDVLLKYAFDHVISLVALCMITAILFASTFLVYRRKPVTHRRRRTSAVTESIDELADAFAKFGQKKGLRRSSA